MKKFQLNRALVAKKKIYLTLLSVLLLSSTAMADDVLFKMIMTAGGNIAVTRQTETTIADNMAFIIGGSASIYDNSTGSAQNLFGKSDASFCRIVSSKIYIKVTLDRALQAGDVISYKAAMTDGRLGDNIVVCRQFENDGVTPKRGSLKVYMDGTANPSYTVRLNDELVGQTEFYIWLGSVGKNTSSQDNFSFITSFTITRSSNLVKFYSFENLTPTDFTSNTTSGNEIVAGELYLNSDGETNGANGIKAASSGKPQSLYSRGANENRALMLKVTDPCTVEIWAWSAQKDLSINEGKYAVSTATKIITGTAAESNVIQKGTYTYTGLEDSKTLYTVPTGGVYVAAIRVTYAKIRPVADLAVSPTELSVRTGKKEDFIISTSSNVAITRDRTNESSSSTVKFSGFTNDDLATPSSPINGTVEGKVAGTYVMTLTQPASADYRAGYAELEITVADEVESDAAVTTSAGDITGGNIWTSTADPNMTFIEDGAGSNTVRTTDKIAGGFTITRNLSYTISVPTNKKITKVTITGYTNGYGDKSGVAKAQIEVNSVNSAELNYIRETEADASTANEPTSIVYSSLNASTFTFKPVNYGIAAKIDIVVEESNKYPVSVINGWASICAPEDVTIPAGLTAYIGIAGSDGNEVLLQEVTSGIIRSNSGVVLAGTDGNYDLVATTGGSGDKGILKYTTKRIANPNKATTYCLNSSVGAFQQYAGNYIPANKAYYTFEAPAGAPARIPIRIVEHENTATAIDNTDQFVGIDYNAPIYNLQGQQVSVTESGIYIQGGRKYLILK